MQATRWAALCGALLIAAAPATAWAGGGHRGHGGHHRGHHARHFGGHVFHHYGGHGFHHYGGYHRGVHFSWGPVWWGPPLVVRERTVVVEDPPVYIQRDRAAVASADPGPSHWWYYCESEAAYYPDVEECAEDWIRVAPRPGS